MRKSKYLVLSSFYFDFNNDLSEIKEIKALFENQNILDLFRFDKMKTIIKEKFSKHENFNFIYLPVSIEKINEYAFWNCKIQILDLSNCINLKNIERSVFYKNQIKYLKLPQTIENINNFVFENNQIKKLKLPKNIEKIGMFAFSNNKIEILDLSQCIKLQTIELSFDNNLIKTLSLPKNIEIIQNFAFRTNQIEILDLSNCIKLKEIKNASFGNNPLKEIKILDNIEIEYHDNNDIWNNFVICYLKNNKKSGDYKLENNKWQWYPL